MTENAVNTLLILCGGVLFMLVLITHSLLKISDHLSGISRQMRNSGEDLNARLTTLSARIDNASTQLGMDLDRLGPQDPID